MVQRKHLFVAHDHVNCDVCGRTLLTGERAEFLVEGAQEPRLVCELCAVPARRKGWRERVPRGADSGGLSLIP
jgi:hypothetical protein